MRRTAPDLLSLFLAVGLAGCSGEIGRLGNGSSGAPAPGKEPPTGMMGARPPTGADLPTGVAPTQASCAGVAGVSAGRWRRLTALQYRNTVRDLLGLEADTSQFLQDTHTGPFATNAGLPPQEADVERYRETAESLATRAVADLPKLLKCDAKATGEDACASRLISDLGMRAYRRPLEREETDALLRLYGVGKMESFSTGVRLVVEAILQSPTFLYLGEVGGAANAGVARLSGYEVASRLSYLLWNTMPDADLFAAARDGKLDAPAGIRAQAERLLASERFMDTAVNFHSELFGVAKLANEGEVSKGTQYPEWNATLRAAMQDEARRFVQHVFTKAGGTVEAMLTLPALFPSGPLATLYAAGAPGPDGRVEITNGSRAGFLTLAGALAAEPALATPYGAVYRGKMIRTHLLCEEIPPPTVQVEFKLPPGADKLSEQQLLRVHQENPTCAPCHTLMDAIGFGFSNYDHIGRYKTTGRDGMRIDATGEIVGMPEGRFDGPKALVSKLAASPKVRACLAKQWFRYTLGRDGSGGDACSVRLMEEALESGAGDIRQGILALVTSDAFRLRRAN